MNLLLWFYRLSWKKVAGAAVFLLLIAIVPISLQVTTNTTRTRSEAALIQPSTPPVTAKFETPTGPPKIFLVDHFFGKTDDSVLIHGENLGGLHAQSAIYLAGQTIPQENLVSWTGSYIEFKVPANARSGQVEVNILGKKTSWPGMFFVVDKTVTSELNLQKSPNNPNLATLVADNIEGTSSLLVWLLVINNEADLQFQALTDAKIKVQGLSLPIGKVYELEISGAKSGELIRVIKPADVNVGIARAEASRTDNSLIPLKANPLYVSF